MEIVPFEPVAAPMLPTSAFPLLLALVTILGCASHAKDLRERNEELEDELAMNIQHMRTLEADKDFLECTLEHMSGTGFNMPEMKNPLQSQNVEEVQCKYTNIDNTIMSILRKTRGKYAHQILTEIKVIFPDTDKHMVNSRLYTMMTGSLVVRKCSNGDKPRWFLK